MDLSAQHDAPVDAEAERMFASHVGRMARSGGDPATILIVDDERVVRTAMRHVLAKYGYTVLEAANGADALQLIRDRAVPIDLLVTDVVMPGMSGLALVEAAEREEPGLPVIYISGQMHEPITQQAMDIEQRWVLAKPLYPAMLMAAVQGALAYGTEQLGTDR